MESNDYAIFAYEGEGYLPLVRFGAWRVAILRNGPRFDQDTFHDAERHLATDEVFVLLSGRATLLTFGREANPSKDQLQHISMLPGLVYNIYQGVWHGILADKDSSVLIIENENTNKENSEKVEMNPQLHQAVISSLHTLIQIKEESI